VFVKGTTHTHTHTHEIATTTTTTVVGLFKYRSVSKYNIYVRIFFYTYSVRIYADIEYKIYNIRIYDGDGGGLSATAHTYNAL